MRPRYIIASIALVALVFAVGRYIASELDERRKEREWEVVQYDRFIQRATIFDKEVRAGSSESRYGTPRGAIANAEQAKAVALDLWYALYEDRFVFCHQPHFVTLIDQRWHVQGRMDRDLPDEIVYAILTKNDGRVIWASEKAQKESPNQAPVPTATSVTPAANAPVAPAAAAAQL